MVEPPMKPSVLDACVFAAIECDAQDLAVMMLLQYAFHLSEAQAWRFTAAEAVIWQQHVMHGWPAVPHACPARLVWVPVIDRGQAAHVLGFISAMFEEFEASDVISIRVDKLTAKRREYRRLLNHAGHTPSSLRADFLRRARVRLDRCELAGPERQALVAFLLTQRSSLAVERARIASADSRVEVISHEAQVRDVSSQHFRQRGLAAKRGRGIGIAQPKNAVRRRRK